MKILFLAIAALLLVRAGVLADTSAPTQPASTSSLALSAAPTFSLAPLSETDAAATSEATGPSSFAQFETHAKPLPISGSMVFALVALFIVAMRLMGLRHAHEMAEHERDSHHGKAQMFRALHQQRSSRD